MLESFLGMLKKRRRVDTHAATNIDPLSECHVNSLGDSMFTSSTNVTAATVPHTHDSRFDDSDVGGSVASRSMVHQLEQFDRPINPNERFVTVIDQLDARVEKFRKDAMSLQEKRDFLLMSVDLIKSHELLQGMSEAEREEITCYIHRVNSRLSTVELNVRTVRDSAQEDALSQINALIDMMITMGDPVISRQRCQQYLNACCSSLDAHLPPGYDEDGAGGSSGTGIEIDLGPVDKKFEGVLLGCTLDDQKHIKRRLQALIGYLNKQTIRQQPI